MIVSTQNKIDYLFLLSLFFSLSSSFVKDLSPDKINVSAFRGEGDLSNLQLNEDVLTDLLELPSWIRLTSAWCNHVSFRISWTKLKSVPITLVRLPFYLLSFLNISLKIVFIDPKKVLHILCHFVFSELR